MVGIASFEALPWVCCHRSPLPDSQAFLDSREPRVHDGFHTPHLGSEHGEQIRFHFRDAGVCVAQARVVDQNPDQDGQRGNADAECGVNVHKLFLRLIVNSPSLTQSSAVRLLIRCSGFCILARDSGYRAKCASPQFDEQRALNVGRVGQSRELRFRFLARTISSSRTSVSDMLNPLLAAFELGDPLGEVFEIHFKRA